MVTCEKMLRGLRVAGTMAVGGARCKASTSFEGEVLHGKYAPVLSCPVQQLFPPVILAKRQHRLPAPLTHLGPCERIAKRD